MPSNPAVIGVLKRSLKILFPLYQCQYFFVSDDEEDDNDDSNGNSSSNNSNVSNGNNSNNSNNGNNGNDDNDDHNEIQKSTEAGIGEGKHL